MKRTQQNAEQIALKTCAPVMRIRVASAEIPPPPLTTLTAPDPAYDP
jgi:hypothetical protein